MGSIFQSVINNAPNMVFDTMKPYMLKETYSKLRTEIDSNIENMMGDYTLPNSISPLDMAIGEGRRRVREMGFDPLIIRNYNHSIGLFGIQLKNTWINGVSSFHRNGDIVLDLHNNTITIGILNFNSLSVLRPHLLMNRIWFSRSQSWHSRNQGLNKLGSDNRQRFSHTDWTH